MESFTAAKTAIFFSELGFQHKHRLGTKAAGLKDTHYLRSDQSFTCLDENK